jgi:hypothetical protein
MSYTFDTELLSAASVNANPALLNIALSSPQVNDPTAYDVIVDSLGPCVEGVAFNKLTVTSANSALATVYLGDGVDSSDVAATGVYTFAAQAVYPQPATALLSAIGAGTSGKKFQINTTVFTLSTAQDLSLNIIALSGVLGTLINAATAINVADDGVVATYTGSTSAVSLKSALSSFIPNTYVLSSQDANLKFVDINNTVAKSDFLSGGSVDTVTIGSTVYTYSTDRILVGATVDLSVTNLISAINGDATYTANTLVTAASSSAVVGLSVVANNPGQAGSDIATTDSASAPGSWGATTLEGGSEALGTKLRVAEAYNGSTFAVLSCGTYFSIFTMATALSAQTMTTKFTRNVSTPEQRRLWVLGYR